MAVEVRNILRMAFRTTDDKKRVLSVSPVKPSATPAQVTTLADALIANKDCLTWSPNTLIGAEIIQMITTDVEFA